MLTYEEILHYALDYRIENGVVFDKNTNLQITDEDIIIKVKSSILLYRESKDSYLSDMQQFGKTNQSQEYYIKKTMEKFSVNNEKNSYGTNKLVNSLLSSNGHYEEYMSGKDLQNSKFSFLVAPKADYGLSYLKLKFREKGLDIDDLQIRLDLTELQKNGYSKVIIDFKLRKYEKSKQNSSTIQFKHPKSRELNELEEQKKAAKLNNDEVAYNYAQAAIENIIRENQVSVAPEQWNLMSNDEKKAFVQLKINESKVLHDKDSFDYWNAIFKNLEMNVGEKAIPSIESPAPINNFQSELNQVQLNADAQKKYNYYYNEMMKAVRKRQTMSNASKEEKKQITGEIFYNEGYLIESLESEEEFRKIMSAIVNDLSDNELDIKLQNIILEDMQDRLNRIRNKSYSAGNAKTNEKESEGPDFTIFITQLQDKIERLKKEYREMLLDGVIDDNELAILINRISELKKDTILLRKQVNDVKEQKILDSIIETINLESIKITNLQKGIEEINTSFGR